MATITMCLGKVGKNGLHLLYKLQKEYLLAVIRACTVHTKNINIINIVKCIVTMISMYIYNSVRSCDWMGFHCIVAEPKLFIFSCGSTVVPYFCSSSGSSSSSCPILPLKLYYNSSTIRSMSQWRFSSS